MKILSHVRLNALRIAVAFAILIAAISILFSSIGSSAAPGQTGHALALRAAIHPGIARKSLASFLKSVQNTPGRYHYPRMVSQRLHPLAAGGSANDSVLISEAVQTYDVFNAAPAFQPGDGDLTPTNLHPVWTGDEQYIVFASNRAHAAAAGGADTVDDGTYHIWSVSAKGDNPLNTTADTSLHQITFSTGSEFFPALNPVNNRQNTQLAFVSTAGNGVRNLYAVSGFNAATSTINVDNLTSLTIRTDLATGIGDVERPTWSPDGQRIAFSALDTTITPASAQVHHIYFLYVTSEGGLNGAQPSPNNPPAKLTTGSANDSAPAWTGPGQADFIAFASTASSITNSTTAPAQTSGTTGATPMRSIYLITGSGTGATRITNTGSTPTTDDADPAWNYNPADTGELAFARSSSINGNHDIYYATVYNGATIFPETTNNPATQLNTADNADNTNQTTANQYDDTYPTFAPFVTIDSLAYQSNRSATYNDQTSGAPLEVAESLAEGSTGSNGQPSVGADYNGILVSEFQNINPPTLIPYSSGEVVHVTNGVTDTPRRAEGLTPGNPVKFTVRLSDRESGVDDGNVYIQIKDPDSKYDDSKGLEHKVFTKDNTDFERNNDSYPSQYIGTDHNGNSIFVSSATYYLYNGGLNYEGGLTGQVDDPLNTEDISGSFFTGNAIQQFTISTTPSMVVTDAELRGAVGGYDTGVNASIAVGLDNGGTNPATYLNSATPAMRVALSGGDPRSFSSFGQEYECQYVNAHYNSGGAPDTSTTDYGTPYYLAGVDDQGAHTGGARPARAEWLQLTRAPTQDNLGGTLYTATWTTPTSPSDYYLDVIAYDKASYGSSFPDTTGSSGTPVAGANMRIYDNVWGFSTQTFSGANDILLVSDNALGQKFVGSTFGGTGLANIPPIFYGAESYLTAIDITKLPNAVYRFVQETGKTPQYNGAAVMPDDSPLAQLVDLEPTDEGLVNGSPVDGNVVLNGLGVGSYFDGGQQDTVDGLAVSKDQEYSIWRTLARGPVTPAVYAAYEPSTENQPAVNDTAAGHVFPAATVNDAHRCIVWVSPYTGDLPFNVVGSLADVNVQTQLRAFVNAGGRLFVSGQNIANALTDGGSQPALNTTGSFLTDVFNATFTPNTGGSQNLSAGGGIGARISGDAFFNASVTLGFIQDFFTNLTANGFKYATPNSEPLILGNNYNKVPTGDTEQFPLWRDDGSLDQLGPAFSSFGFSGNDAESQIDIITPQNGATPDINIAGPGNGGQFTAGTGSGLIYHEASGANGGKAIFSSFGLEGLGIEYYKFTSNNVDSFYARNQRPNILHNIVTFLRTGTFTGTVFAGSGASGGAGTTVSGATVYLLPNEGKTIPGTNANGTPIRQAYSAQTLSDGTYRIDGVEPGSYIVDAYRTGYADTQANAAYGVTGNSQDSVSLDIVPVPPGSLSGKVVDQAGSGISGAQLQFVSTDGQATATGTTNLDGTYTITNVQAGTYNGTVTATGYQAPTAGTTPGATVTGIVVQSSSTTPNVNFALALVPATLGGLVSDDFSGTSVTGATLTVKNSTTGLTVATFTTGATTTPAAGPTGDGQPENYTGSLSAGTYTVTVTPPAGYTNPQPTTATVTIASGAFMRINFTLTSSTGQIGGLVVDESGAPLDGATVTVTNSAGTTVGTFPTTATDPDTAAAPVGDGQPANYFGSLAAGGPYTVTISAPNRTPQTITSVTIVRHEFSRVNSNMGGLVSTLGILQGLITDASTGAPIAGATVTIDDSTGNPVAGSPFTTTAGTTTNYGPVSLTEGTYTLIVSAANHATVTATAAVVHDQTVTKNVALPSSQGDLGGLITDSFTHQPLAGATVTVSDSTGAVVATVTSKNAVSSPAEPIGDGASQNYSSTQLMDGTYTVSVAATNHTTQNATAAVSGGVFTRQNFALVSTLGTVGGLVEDSFTGAPISGVTVTVANATTGVTVATFSTSATVSAAPDGGQLNYSGSLAQGTYTVTITRRGYGAVASRTITITPNAFTRADFTGTGGLPPGHIFNGTGQYLFFSVPYDYASSGVGFDQLFGVLNTGTFSPLVLDPPNANRSHVYVWDPTALDYATEPTPPADGLHLGQGYWVYLVKPTEANVAGTAATGTVSVPLKIGWNMIGVPSLSAISLSNVTFNNPSTNATVTFAQAASTYKLISSPLYGYTTGGGYYQVAAGASLQPWQAYWIYAFSPTTIEMPTGQ